MPACTICHSISGAEPWYPVAQTDRAVAFLNPRQRSRGALLVVPTRHVVLVTDLEQGEFAEIFYFLQQLARSLTRVFKPDGIHTWCRLSRETPTEFEHHHFQLVPRYEGEPYSYAKSWELPLTSESTLAEYAAAIRADLGIERLLRPGGHRGN